MTDLFDPAQKTILLVEDDVITATVEKRALEKRGYNIFHSTTGEKALKYFIIAPSVELVLMDIDLGKGIDGIETAKQLLAVRDVPIVFLSNQTEADMIRKIEKVTSYGYVVKKSGITILEASIKMAFRLFDANMIIRVNEIKQKAMIANISDVICVIGSDATVKYISPNVEKWFGWLPADLVGFNGWNNVHPDDAKRVDHAFYRFLGEDKKMRTVEFRSACKDGTYKPIEVTATNLLNDPVIGGILLNYRDISERKAADIKLSHVARLYALLSQINQAIVRIKCPEELFRTICKVAVDYGGFRFARIELTDAERVMTESEIFLEWGCASHASVAFTQKGRIAGTLNLYAAEEFFFTAEENELLDEIGGDISFALDAMDSETERKRAEEAVLTAITNIALREIETLSVLGRASEYKDADTADHIGRVALISKFIAKAMGLDNAQQKLIYHASALHDVGKLGIPDSIIFKPGSLSEEEFIKMKTHTAIGFDILKSSKSMFLQIGAEIALTHHEKFSGGGYPRSLKGEEIPLFGRIVAVADAFDAMKSKRPYKESWPLEKVVGVLISERGGHFDPAVVDALLSVLDTVEDGLRML